ncbi:phage tail protein [Serratia ficaria]|uniref:phage tail protein n=1 Tax=Serratia ficaria TaxID=61651 RepID=UPI002179239E|nr:phage tail protein [Serratia ficaria]CAI0760094.1 Tail fiber protein [Serratia ficaria]CAI1569603.1 Tail fiber protein [Serratia ficaria]CAI2405234.1 Tail fiber protein [Serratia ficaria]CAI2431421.1 Tail fiber protein [Serratia ficaria]CAI2499211.1 Tail fiber protein [Serratia ficaria]
MSAIITRKYEQWAASQTAQKLPARPDTFVFAYIPDQDPNAEISRDEPLPAPARIVHTAPVMQYGMLNTDAVVFSVVLDTTVGDFDYNWIGLVDQDSNTLCMIVHTRTQRKIATSGQAQGNTLTRTLAMEFNGAAGTAQINVTPQTWQIDFSARLLGVDERQRLAGLDIYGPGAFFDDGFLVTRAGDNYQAAAGLGYVGGLRGMLPEQTPVTVDHVPTLIWADLSLQGQVTSRWETVVKLTAADNLQDYIDPQGFQHHVTQLARINEDGSVTDLRPKGSQGEQEANRIFLRKDQNLADVANKAAARQNIDVFSKGESDNRFVNQAGDNITWLTVEDGLTVNGKGFMVKNGPGDIEENNERQTDGLRIAAAGDLFADLYHRERIGQNHYMGIRVANGGADGWFEFRNDGHFLTNGKVSAGGEGGGALHTDGNIQGSIWNGYLKDWLNSQFTATKDFVYQNYLSGVQLGARQTQEHINNLWTTPAGCALTGMSGDSDNDAQAQYAPIQVLRNGVWATIAG